MRNFSKNYPLNCLKEGDAAYIADMVTQIMGDEEQFKASVDKFFSDLHEPLEAGFKACARAHGKTPEELTDEGNQRCCAQACRAFHGRDD